MDAGVTDMATLVVTPPTVLSITPAPSVNIAVKSTLDPAVMVAADEVKLVMDGSGTGLPPPTHAVRNNIKNVSEKAVTNLCMTKSLAGLADN